MADVVPLSIKAEIVPNDPRMEVLFDIVEGLPPARQKRIILRARDPEVAWIDDQQATIAMDALGLSAA